MSVKLNIDDKLYAKMKDRLRKLILAYGAKKIGFQTTDEFANYILKGYIEKKENEAKNKVPNSGVDWTEYKRQIIGTVFIAAEGRCQYCQKELSHHTATLDHDVPPIRGGQNILSNMVLSCKWCNQDKGVLTRDEYQYKQLANAAKGTYPPGYMPSSSSL